MMTRQIDGTRAAGGVRMGTALAGLALVAGAAGTAGAQETAGADPRWQAWAGCWAPGSDSSTPIAENAPVVCVIPLAGGSRAELVAIGEGKVVARELVVATGERQPSQRDGCEGWETAEWSADGHRVYRRSEHSCANGVRRVSNGVLAMGTQGEWLDVRGVGREASAGVVAVRYRPAAPPAGLPAELAARMPVGGAAPELRLAAGAPLGPDAVVEMARKLDLPVAEALLIERGQGFQVDGRRLVSLADRGVPPRLIDAMVALSYPKVFAVNARTRSTDRVAAAGTQVAGGGMAPGMGVGYGWSPWGWSPWGWGSAMGFSPLGYRYGYGNGWGGFSPWGVGLYGNGGPIIVVRGDENGGASQPRGRAVRGRGYTQGTGSGSAGPRPSAASGGGYSSGGSSSGGSSSGSSSGSGSSGSGRTAQPRTP